jgi:glucosyl-dolichyl phosphate glucuronosyltransferase
VILEMHTAQSENQQLAGKASSEGPVTITVVVCTYNRCDILPRALESIAASSLPGSLRWEALIVDNNSTDRTREVAHEFCSRHPGLFRYVFEPQPGLSQARNAGVREARGSILAFTDDDVTVEPTWLQNLTATLYGKTYAGSGGRILPERTFSPPSWLELSGPRNLLGALCAYRDPGDVPGDFKDPPYGANMAFRKEMFEKYGHFRTDLGHRPDSKIGFEDTEFGRRLMAGGERLSYVPSAVVYHEVDERKVRKDYLLAWWFDFGRGEVRQSESPLSTTRILKILARTALTTPRWLLTVGSQRRFYLKTRIWYEVGKIVELYRQSRAVGHKREKVTFV